MTRYHRRIYRLTAARPGADEVLAARLWACGALGCEIRDRDGLVLEAWFRDPLPAGVEELRGDGSGIELLATETVADRDWLAAYRAAAEPFDVGRRFRIDPGDREGGGPPPGGGSEPGARFLLRIPARTAFGTGSHESTRLVLEWLEDLDLAGADFLDVGTGSGILALAALGLGAGRAVGFDRDAPSVLVARQNARLNALAPSLFAGRLAALRSAPAFDFVLVNILPERIRREIPLLVPLIRRSGRLLSSGHLWQHRADVVGSWTGAGLELLEQRRDGEWGAFLFRPRS